MVEGSPSYLSRSVAQLQADTVSILQVISLILGGIFCGIIALTFENKSISNTPPVANQKTTEVPNKPFSQKPFEPEPTEELQQVRKSPELRAPKRK